MSDKYYELSPAHYARFGGYSLLAMFLLVILTEMLGFSKIIDWQSAQNTFENFKNSTSFFRVGVMSFLIVYILDVIVSLALFVLFRPVNNGISLMAMWFRLVYTAMIGAVTVFQFNAVRLVSNTEFSQAYSQEQLSAAVMNKLQSHADGYSAALIFFGIHLLLLGYLILKSGFVPKLIGYIVLFAGFSYFADNFINLSLPLFHAQYKSIFLVFVAIPGILGELSLAIWLVARSKNMNDLTQTI